MKLLSKTKDIYFIGIGGIGMSGIAEILHEMNFSISGSDISENQNTIRLKELGIKINIGQKKENINNIDMIVVSSAIKKNNPELIKATSLNIPILPRAKMLSEILHLKSSITIAGSHGKTTTTSLVASLLEEAKLDPTVINGGIINTYKTNAKLGKGEWIIAEADESDGSFTYLPSTICLVNNIDPEHLDYYGSFKKLKTAFLNYIENIPFYGFASLCIDHKEVREIMKNLKNKKIITFGFSKKAHFSIKNNSIKELGGIYYNKFDVIVNLKKRYEIKDIIFPMLGKHNLQNALGAISIATNIGISDKNIKEGLRNFRGVKRRFTQVKKINSNKIFDDYAHHPKEILATLSSLKQITKGKIIAIYEPHRYSRLEYLFDDFTNCFGNANFLLILPVYSAGEKINEEFNSQKLVEFINKKMTTTTVLIKDESKLFKKIVSFLKPDDNIIFLGAGPITKLANLFPDYLEKN